MIDARLHNVSDTAIVTAVARARETEEPDPVFRDPFAVKLAGDHFEAYRAKLRYRAFFSGIIARTATFDEFIARSVADDGVRCVVNLGAGLDARPYRLTIPAGLRWVEADQPSVIEYKTMVLEQAQPRCVLERFGVDLSVASARCELLDRAGHDPPTLVVTEGVVPYLEEPVVEALARELHERPSYRWWAVDLLGASLRRVANALGRRQLGASGASFRFAPPNGAEFFRQLGWDPVDVRTSWSMQRRIRREPGLLRALGILGTQRVKDAVGKTGVFVLLRRSETRGIARA